MAGVRDRNLRSGDTHEDFGLFLLKTIALVAPIPRTEDVGADAFATLLRAKSSRQLAAEDSFLVQIKASSERKIKYETEDDVRWLTQLEIPLFIASVDLANSSISLYPTHRLSGILIEGIEYRQIHLYIDKVDESSSPEGIRYGNLGPPAMTWSVVDLDKRGFVEKAYSIMKPHISKLRDNIQFRPLRYQEPVKWEENEVPLCEQGSIIMGSSCGENKAIMEKMIPSIRALVSDIIAKKRYGDLHAVMPFINMMIKYGVNPYPDGSSVRMMLLMADGDEISESEIISCRTLAIPGQLDLTGVRITDESLKNIPESTKWLSLAKTQISDDGLKHLTRLQNLSRLNLAETRITDKGLGILKSLINLEWINLSNTDITEIGIEQLRKSLSKAKIIN